MRTHAFRLAPGTDLKAELQRLTEEHGLRAACVGYNELSIDLRGAERAQ